MSNNLDRSPVDEGMRPIDRPYRMNVTFFVGLTVVIISLIIVLAVWL